MKPWPTTDAVAGIPVARTVALWTLLPAGLIATGQIVGPFGNNVLIAAAVTMLVACGLHVLIHWAGQVSLGQVAFVGVGGFVSARASGDWGLPVELAVLAGGVAAMALSAGIGLPALRLRGFSLAIATLVFGFSADRWLFQQEWLAGYAYEGVAFEPTARFAGLGIESSEQLLIPVAVVLFLVVLATVLIGESAFGRALRLVAADENVAASYGIDVATYKLFAFLYAGLCAGVAGAVLALSLLRVGRDTFGFEASITYVAAVLLGGAGSLSGALLAAGVLGASPILLGSQLGKYSSLVGACGMLAVVITSGGGVNAFGRRLARGARSIAAPRRLPSSTPTPRWRSLARSGDTAQEVQE